MTAYTTIAVERVDGWLNVWLDRPEARNALSSDMVRELTELFDACAAERGLRGMTLRGKGGTFCAGGDLKTFHALASGATVDSSAVFNDSVTGGKLFEKLDRLPFFVLVLIEGAAMAGGLGMACCADAVVATRDAKFGLTETTLGIPPAQIAPFVQRRVGFTKARRLMLSAARFTGEEALNLGIADFLAEDAADLATIGDGIVAQVRRCAPGANAATKALLLDALGKDTNDIRDMAAKCFADCLLGAEGREGVRAFAEKRAPAWASKGA